MESVAQCDFHYIQMYATMIRMGKTPPGQTRHRVFRFVRQRLLAGEPPTVREVQEEFGFRSVQTARQHLETLVGKGLLTKTPSQARGYRLPQKVEITPRWVPLLGRVQAGSLTTAIEDLEGYLPLDASSARVDSEAELFGLKVRGDSMSGIGILEGDVVVVRRQPNADSGAIVVALVDDEATVKRLVKRNGGVELHPENPDHEPIIPDPEELAILGKVIEVRRFLK